MKTILNNRFLLPALIAGLALLPEGRAAAQTFTTLHDFTSVSDGASPTAGLILSGNALYGTASSGGSSGNGAVIRMNTDGTGFTNLHSFGGGDGDSPNAGLILAGNTLYGTTKLGGSAGYGTVFKVNTNGTGFTNLHHFSAAGSPTFTNADGARPVSGLVLSGSTLYGTAAQGGTSSDGVVFAVNTDGSGFTNLHNFAYGTDGGQPQAGLILSGNTLYGTATFGGSSGVGTVFKLGTNGAGFLKLHTFTDVAGDGAYPYAGLVLSGNTLYGTTFYGGNADKGMVFGVNTDGSGYTNLYLLASSGGTEPKAGLVLSGNALYGTTSAGGTSGYGTVFRISTTGTGFADLYDFTGGSDGAGPVAGLILWANTLYGTAQSGGDSGNGTVFSLSVAVPQLAINPAGTNVVLTWPTNDAGFTLQSTTNLASPTDWTSNPSAPVVVGGQNTVTNSISVTRKLFRLIQ